MLFVATVAVTVAGISEGAAVVIFAVQPAELRSRPAKMIIGVC